MPFLKSRCTISAAAPDNEFHITHSSGAVPRDGVGQ